MKPRASTTEIGGAQKYVLDICSGSKKVTRSFGLLHPWPGSPSAYVDMRRWPKKEVTDAAIHRQAEVAVLLGYEQRRASLTRLGCPCDERGVVQIIKECDVLCPVRAQNRVH
eukprot:1599155-Pyramimonas_sp.AAC.1